MRVEQVVSATTDAAPFIHIAALRRTGSTVLSESLTSLPTSYIFVEPKLGRDRFTVMSSEVNRFLELGIDLKAFAREWSGNPIASRLLRRNKVMTAFKENLVPQLLTVVRQIGVKEIHHEGWRFYEEAFPDRKIILTARDPRDIFISTHHRVVAGKDRFRRGFSARELARTLNRDFKGQRDMCKSHSFFKARYEDFCCDPKVLEDVKSFAGSRIGGMGEIGQFNAPNPRRAAEATLHGGEVTRQRIERWKHETDKDVLREAHRTFDLMPEYVEFWGYER